MTKVPFCCITPIGTKVLWGYLRENMEIINKKRPNYFGRIYVNEGVLEVIAVQVPKGPMGHMLHMDWCRLSTISR